MTIVEIQRLLKSFGYAVPETGRLDETSKAAVEQFQTAWPGVVVDGDPGPETQKALAKASAANWKVPKVLPAPAAKLLDASSEARLVGVHPDLVRVVRRAAEISALPFRILEGVRTLARQKQLVAKGASQTLRSRHIPAGRPSVAHAVDLGALVGGSVRWDWPLYDRLAVAMKQAAHDVGVPIEWGGDWKTFKDGPHFQLPWAKYPG